MPISKNPNLTKFGTRRVSTQDMIQNADILLLNQKFINLETKQTADILNLEMNQRNEIIRLEKNIYDLKQIIINLTNIRI